MQIFLPGQLESDRRLVTTVPPRVHVAGAAAAEAEHAQIGHVLLGRDGPVEVEHRDGGFRSTMVRGITTAAATDTVGWLRGRRGSCNVGAELLVYDVRDALKTTAVRGGGPEGWRGDRRCARARPLLLWWGRNNSTFLFKSISAFFVVVKLILV